MNTLSPRTELIQLQKRIFKKNQKIIQDSILISEPGFSKYEKNYLRHVQSFEKPAEVRDLKQQLAKAEWIYLGDYHTNRQSQRSLLRILKMLIGETDQFVICLEFLHKRHQTLVEKFLQLKLTLAGFLKGINLKKNFYFDLWENFEPIFDFARYYQVDVYGIESAPFGAGLKRRDEAMAKTLADISEKHPGYKKIIFVGDLHIAPENLPARVKKQVGNGKELNELYIYQNSEKIYFDLAKDHLEDKVEVVRIDDKSFCLLNTPPIVWQQSYLNWLENEEGEIDYQDPKHSFLDLADQIAKFLGIKLPKEKEDVEVFTCGDFSFLERLQDDPGLSREEKKNIRSQVELSESYYFPKYKWVYLANVSLNHAAEEASHFIRHLMAGDEFPRSSQDAFYANVLHEALGFFGSKIINSKRKCTRVNDFKSMMEYFKKTTVPRGRSFEFEIALMVVQIQKREEKGKPIANPNHLVKNHELFFGVSHALGYILGELLYHAMIQEKISKKALRDLFYNPFSKEGEPFQVYKTLVKKFKMIKLPHRI